MKERTRSRNYLSLLIGIAFVSYGGYRLISFYMGAPYNTFRVIVDIALVLFGAWDIYRFFKTPSKK